jgi:hypothetical protein
MLPLRFYGSRPRSASESSSRRSPVLRCLAVRLASIVGASALLGTIACSNDDGDGGGTVALADSGVIQELTNEMGIPTTVAVAGGVAWVVESQFDRYVPFGGVGAPAPFRLIGVRLDGSNYSEIPLPDNFFPEGIAATAGGRLFVGSIATGDIYTVDPNADEADLFAGNLKPATVGMTVSVDNQTLWYCSTDLAATPPVALVIGVGIADRARVGTHELEPAGDAGAFCNDLVMSPDGALWITESFGGRIFRIAAENLLQDNSAVIWLEDSHLAPPEPGQFGANGITLLGGRLFTVVTDPGTLFAIDPTLAAPTGADLKAIALGSPLVRPDGITRVPGSDTDILIVENGLGVAQGGKKLLRARLDRL